MKYVDCRRCGRCCYYMKNGKKVKCKFLVRHKTITSCRVYHQRVRFLDYGDNGSLIVCMNREELTPEEWKKLFPFCPTVVD